MISCHGIAIHNALSTTNYAALANFARCHPLLIVHELMRERVKAGSKRVVPPALFFELQVVSCRNSNERLYVSIVRREEGCANSIAVHRDDLLAGKEVYRHAYRKIVFLA